MKIETLKERITKTKENITKSTATLERHNTQLAKKVKALTAKGIELTTYNKFNREVIDHDTYWELCDYEHKLEDIENTEKKITDYNKTLEGLDKQLKDQLAKDKEVHDAIPEVLNQFLEQWKQKCIEFYERLSNDYLALIKREPETFTIAREELTELTTEKFNTKTRRYEKVRYYTEEQLIKILSGAISDYDKHNIHCKLKNKYILDFTKRHFASDMAVVIKITEGYKLNKKLLNRILDEDVRLKKQQFIMRIKEVIGEVKDLKGLKISAQGEINGIAKGVKCNARVETITAGGYNIQCFHYRVLVNVAK